MLCTKIATAGGSLRREWLGGRKGWRAAGLPMGRCGHTCAHSPSCLHCSWLAGCNQSALHSLKASPGLPSGVLGASLRGPAGWRQGRAAQGGKLLVRARRARHSCSTRCGSILTQPLMAPWSSWSVGGTQVVNSGKQGNYKAYGKEVVKE